jgi:hypothetical protein
MMTPKEKAEYLVDTNRIVLMSEDTDCGEEILCTTISIKLALICVDEIIKNHFFPKSEYWNEVKQEINKL